MGKVIELDDVFAGSHINAVCEKAATEAQRVGKPVHFVFNGIHVTVAPGEGAEVASARWTADFEARAKAWRESPECAALEAKRTADDKAADEAHMIETAKNEKEMREAKVPWPRTEAQLLEYIRSLVEREHDYGTCVYAMSMAAEAAFNYVAHRLGVTGFQSSCADMDFLSRTRGIKGPWMILKAEDALYPQYDLRGKLNKMLTEAKPWLKEQATAKLAETKNAHPDVISHWKRLAELPHPPLNSR